MTPGLWVQWVAAIAFTIIMIAITITIINSAVTIWRKNREQ